MVAWNMGQVSLGFMPVVGVWGCSEVLGGGGLLIWGGGLSVGGALCWVSWRSGRAIL